MPRTVDRWKIDGLHPAEYANLWGSGTRDGMRFYNCASMNRYTGAVESNPDWDRSDWEALASAARDQSRAVAREVRTAKGRNRTGWTYADCANLDKLADWAVCMANRADSTSPWVRRVV